MLLNREGLVFVGRRRNGGRSRARRRRHDWQMPQGGIDDGEDPYAAALRELYEETNVRSASSCSPRSQDWLAYDLPGDVAGTAWKGRYRGQTQKWFAFRFPGDEQRDRHRHPAGGHRPEFDAWRWERMDGSPELIIPFKRPVYERVVESFAHLAASGPA